MQTEVRSEKVTAQFDVRTGEMVDINTDLHNIVLATRQSGYVEESIAAERGMSFDQLMNECCRQALSELDEDAG